MTHRSLVMIRPNDAAQKFVTALENHMGAPVKALFSPLIGIEPLACNMDLRGVTLLLFTSVNGVEHFARATDQRDIDALCVGVTTQKAAIAHGMKAKNAGGTAVQLLSVALEIGRLEGQKILYPSGEQVSFDLITPLRAADIAVDQAILYRQAPLEISPLAIKEISSANVVIPVFSLNGANTLVAALAGVKPKNTLLLAISPQVADQLRAAGFRNVLCAKSPTRDAMIHALGKLL